MEKIIESVIIVREQNIEKKELKKEYLRKKMEEFAEKNNLAVDEVKYKEIGRKLGLVKFRLYRVDSVSMLLQNLVDVIEDVDKNLEAINKRYSEYKKSYPGKSNNTKKNRKDVKTDDK